MVLEAIEPPEPYKTAQTFGMTLGFNRRYRAYLQGLPHDRMRGVGVDRPYSPNEKVFGMMGPNLGTREGDLLKFQRLFSTTTRVWTLTASWS